jgi:hypothetical protein
MNTSASGSAFEVTVVTQGANGATAPTITDNMGNNAKWATALIGAVFSNTNTENIWRFAISNAAGGVGHQATATFAAAPGILEIVMMEMTGMVTSAVVDQSNTGTSGASTGPATSGNITVNPPASGEILSAVILGHSGSNLVFAESTGFVIQASMVVAATSNTQWALATKIVSAPNTYAASWTWGGGNIFIGALIDSFKGAPAGGGSSPGTGGMISSGKWLWSKRR